LQEIKLIAQSWASTDDKQAAVEVEEMEPTNKELAATMQTMKDRGIGMLYGRWLIEGAPRVLLIDIKTAYNFVNEWKSDLWSVAGIPSPPDDDETNDAIIFGYLVAWFLGEVRIFRFPDPNDDVVTGFPSLYFSTFDWLPLICK
jgi:hypothetical protein